MYLEFFGLKKFPFQLKPDPGFLYLSNAHSRAKAYMEYTVWNRDGFLVITGEIGSGKTTLVRGLLADLDKSVTVASIHQTQLTQIEFLQSLLSKFGIEAWDANKPQLHALLRDFLVDQKKCGKQVLLVIDEAQYLDKQALEEVRLIAGTEVDGEEVMSLILVGHPELMDIINAPDMEQFSQRVRLRHHIGELSITDMRHYIHSRLKMAGNGNPNVFHDNLMPVIYEYTGGTPRLINILCHASLMTAFVEDSNHVTDAVLRTSIAELNWQRYNERAHKARQ